MSNKAGNLTGGTVGQETIVYQTTQLVGHSIEFAKGFVVTGIHPVTLGDLVNESRDLTAFVLEGVQSVVAGGADKAKEAAGEGQAQGKGLVQQCRGIAAAAIGTAHEQVRSSFAGSPEANSPPSSIIATGGAKAQKTATDAKGTASGVAGDVGKQASKAGSTVQSKAQEAKRQTMG